MSDSCPKCGAARRDGAIACSRCGLATDRMASYATDLEANIPDVLTVAWERATEAWDDQTRHDEILRLVSQHEAYAWAAARYRMRGDEIGERQLARIKKAAEATMFATAAMRKETKPKPYRALTTVMLMLIVAAGAGLLYAMVMSNDDKPPSKNAQPAPSPTKPSLPLDKKVR